MGMRPDGFVPISSVLDMDNKNWKMGITEDEVLQVHCHFTLLQHSVWNKQCRLRSTGM